MGADRSPSISPVIIITNVATAVPGVRGACQLSILGARSGTGSACLLNPSARATSVDSTSRLLPGEAGGPSSAGGQGVRLRLVSFPSNMVFCLYGRGVPW
jgi:hypothetical protein